AADIRPGIAVTRRSARRRGGGRTRNVLALRPENVALMAHIGSVHAKRVFLLEDLLPGTRLPHIDEAAGQPASAIPHIGLAHKVMAAGKPGVQGADRHALHHAPEIASVGRAAASGA